MLHFVWGHLLRKQTVSYEKCKRLYLALTEAELSPLAWAIVLSCLRTTVFGGFTIPPTNAILVFLQNQVLSYLLKTSHFLQLTSLRLYLTSCFAFWYEPAIFAVSLSSLSALSTLHRSYISRKDSNSSRVALGKSFLQCFSHKGPESERQEKMFKKSPVNIR